MGKYNSDEMNVNQEKKQKIRKFKDHQDEAYSNEEKKEFYKRKKKLGKKKRKIKQDYDLPISSTR
ncbi:hypothetical protein [Desulfobacula toluolica]|uniref:hypothetical protein n=1 Tax=Desulfobacula toluolica TaxID=28223 RepID=UPI0002D7D68A|nr:hypothetical protein [Desulfobacula toluolica]